MQLLPFTEAQGHSYTISEKGLKCEVTISRIPSIFMKFKKV